MLILPLRKTSPVDSTASGSSTLYTTGGASYSKRSSTSAKAIEQTPEHQALRMMTIKTTVDAVCKPPYKKSLSELVRVTNTLVTHTYAFLKFIFLRELQEDQRFDMRLFLTEKFFIQVFYSLVQKYSHPQRHTAETSKYRALIGKHLTTYLSLSGYRPLTLQNSQQIALYECKKIFVSYMNNIRTQFGKRFREFCNKLTVFFKNLGKGGKIIENKINK